MKDGIGAKKVKHLAVSKNVQSVKARSVGNAIKKVKSEHQYCLFIRPSSYTDRKKNVTLFDRSKTPTP